MLWASSGGAGGYPGVVSFGGAGLEMNVLLLHGVLDLLRGVAFFLVGPGSDNLLFIHEGHKNDGLSLLNGVGVFGHDPPAHATTGGTHTAGGTYTVVEQAMLEACYTALQSIGLVT